jgi:antitoxin component of RelBE/YafQ-DinJ toxin-antitoxin module
MVNVSVPFPEDLRERAEAVARQRGLTLDEFVRRCVSTTVDQGRLADPLFADTEVFEGEVPADLSENHDDYLYGDDA